MRSRLISLFISYIFIITMGFKVVIYANTEVLGEVNVYELNVRSGPGTNYPVIAKLQRGSKVNIISQSKGWLNILHEGSNAYVSNDYVSSIYSDVCGEGVISGCSFLNVRGGPGKGYAVRGLIASGTEVNIIGYENGWCKIIFENNYAYVSSTYISSASETLPKDDKPIYGSGNPSDSTENSTGDDTSNNGSSKPNDTMDNNGNMSDGQNSNYTSSKLGTVTASYLNVRKSSTSLSASVGILTHGDEVTIVDEAGNWYKIVYKDEYAFVSKGYISLKSIYTVSNLNGFLFVGDSYTNRLKTTIANNTLNSVVLSKSGAYPSEWINRFSEMPDNSSIKGVSLLIGINGVTRESNVADTKNLIDLLSKKYCDKPIFVQKVFPVGKGYCGYSDAQVAIHNNKIASFNRSIKLHCATKNNVKFVDATDGFVDEDGCLLYCESDSLHVSWSYNTKLFNNIKQAILNAK